MVNFNNWLTIRAQDLVEAAQQRIKGHLNEIDDANMKLEKANTALQSALLSVDRLPHFEPFIKDEHQCPDCWITREIRSNLKPIPSDSSIDFFRCETCTREISNE